MKFYKVHATKYKNEKAVFIGEQFDEIGPDAFSQSEFEYIILSDSVTVIRDYAFSGVKGCSIFVPASVEEIEPFAFDGMGSFNIIYCEKGNYVYNRCVELGVSVDTDVATCLSGAKKKKEIDNEAKNDRIAKETAQKEAEIEKKKVWEEAGKIIYEAQIEAQRIVDLAKTEELQIKTNAQEEAAKIKSAAQEDAKKIRVVAQNDAEKIINVARETAKKIRMAAQTDVENRRNPNQSAAGGMRVQPNYVANRPVRPVETERIFNDESRKPIGTGTKKDNDRFFSGIDAYDDELKNMKDPIVKKPVSRPVVQSKPVVTRQAKPYSGSIMRNLDEYDDELKEMSKKKKQSRSDFGW